MSPSKVRTPTLEELVLTRNALAWKPDAEAKSGLSKIPTEPASPKSWQGQWADLSTPKSGYSDQNGNGRPNGWILPLEEGRGDGSDSTGRNAEWHSQRHESFGVEVKDGVSAKERQTLRELRRSGAAQSLLWTVPELKPERVRAPLRKRGSGLAFGRPQSVMASHLVSRDPRLSGSLAAFSLTKPRPLSYESRVESSVLPKVATRHQNKAGSNRRPYTALGNNEDTAQHLGHAHQNMQTPRNTQQLAAATSPPRPQTVASTEKLRNPKETEKLTPSKQVCAQTAGPCFHCANKQTEKRWLSSTETVFEKPLPWMQADAVRTKHSHNRRTEDTHRRAQTAAGSRKDPSGVFSQRAQTAMGRYHSTGFGRSGVIGDDITEGHVPRSEAVSGLFRSALALEGRLRSLELLCEDDAEALQKQHLRMQRGSVAPDISKGRRSGQNKRPATTIGERNVASDLSFEDGRNIHTAQPSGSRSQTKPLDFLSETVVLGDGNKSEESVLNFYSPSKVRQAVNRIHNLAADMGEILQGQSEESKELAATRITKTVRGYLCRKLYQRGLRALRQWRREEFAPVRALLTAWLRKRAAQEVRIKAIVATRKIRRMRAVFGAWREEAVLCRDERLQKATKAERLRGLQLQRRSAGTLRAWLEIAAGPKSRAKCKERFEIRYAEARDRLEVEAEQRGWPGGITEEMIMEEMHGAAVGEQRAHAHARALSFAFREWRKLTYVRQGLKRYKQRLQKRVMQELVAFLWDKRSRLGEDLWARRKIHRTARLLGRKKLLSTAWDTWRVEVELDKKARAFRERKDHSRRFRALPVALRRDQSMLDTWSETVGDCATWVVVEAAPLARAFRRWQAFVKLAKTQSALRDAMITADRRRKGAGLVRTVFSAWVDSQWPGREKRPAQQETSMKEDGASSQRIAGGSDKPVGRGIPQSESKQHIERRASVELLKAALLDRRYEPAEHSQAPADAELRRLRDIVEKLEVEMRKESVPTS